MVGIEDYGRQLECRYKGELYSVRDNGAVLRHPRDGKAPRPTDNAWTFGKPNDKTGYMEIAAVRVHRIVATCFHGEPPTPEHVVDHIDTNRRNNRPENLRWLTRLENTLLNPITVKRIELVCGSLDAFLKDPSSLRGSTLDKNFSWMRTVSAEEAQSCLARMSLWATSDKPASGGSIGEWVYRPPASTSSGETPPPPPRAEPLVMALTPGAAQRDWRIPSEFPYCPDEPGDDPLGRYAAALREGNVFSRNHTNTSTILEWAVSEDHRALWVLTGFGEDAIKPWALAEVTHEGGLFVHSSRGTFFSREGADKQFCLARGLEWNGEDSIDDYC